MRIVCLLQKLSHEKKRKEKSTTKMMKLLNISQPCISKTIVHNKIHTLSDNVAHFQQMEERFDVYQSSSSPQSSQISLKRADQIYKDEEYGLKDEKSDLEEENLFHTICLEHACSKRQIGVTIAIMNHQSRAHITSIGIIVTLRSIDSS